MTKRVRHGEDYWREQIRLWSQSDQTQAVYCESTGLSLTSFVRWKSRLKMPTGQSRTPAKSGKPQESFVPVRVVPMTEGSRELGSLACIRIRIEGAPWVVEISSAVNSVDLANVLAAVVRAPR